MTKKRACRQYDDEFKNETLTLINEQSYSVAEAAKALGITTSLVYSWKRKADTEISDTALSSNERDELKRLRTKKNA